MCKKSIFGILPSEVSGVTLLEYTALRAQCNLTGGRREGSILLALLYSTRTVSRHAC